MNQPRYRGRLPERFLPPGDSTLASGPPSTSEIDYACPIEIRRRRARADDHRLTLALLLAAVALLLLLLFASIWSGAL